MTKLESLSQEMAEKFILELLRKNGQPMKTQEIEEVNMDLGKKCQDSAVLVLTKMRSRGLIIGEVSYEQGGWLWSLPE